MDKLELFSVYHFLQSVHKQKTTGFTLWSVGRSAEKFSLELIVIPGGVVEFPPDAAPEDAISAFDGKARVRGRLWHAGDGIGRKDDQPPSVLRRLAFVGGSELRHVALAVFDDDIKAVEPGAGEETLAFDRDDKTDDGFSRPHDGCEDNADQPIGLPFVHRFRPCAEEVDNRSARFSQKCMSRLFHAALLFVGFSRRNAEI